MILSEIGKIVEQEWLKTPDMRPDMNLQLGEFAIMPNHFHAIILIGDNKYNSARRDAMHCVSTTKNHFGPQSKNLASIIRGFKSAVTTNARKIHADFEWQSRFYDHIIRDDDEYIRIAQYITTNVANWSTDKFNQPDSL
jgi:putative transposase